MRSNGVRFRLVSLKRKGSLEQFCSTKLCKTVLGNMTALFNHQRHLPLKEVPDQSRYYPYADNEMISTCLACDVIRGGGRGGGEASDFNCRKCVQFDRRLAHYFEFFAAKDATISTRYPLDINNRQYSFSQTCAFESHGFANIFIPIPNTYVCHE